MKNDMDKYRSASSDYLRYSDKLKQDRPIFNALVRMGLLGSLLLLVLAIICPIFIPKILKWCETTIPKHDENGRPLYDRKEYQKELRATQIAYVVIIMMIWSVAALFIWFCYATAPY